MPAVSRQLLSEVIVMGFNNLLDYSRRLSAIVEYAAIDGRLTEDVTHALNDYLRQCLEKECASEDDNSTLRSKFIESIVSMDKRYSLEHMRSLHEAALVLDKSESTEMTIKKLAETMCQENSRPEYDRGLEHTIRYKDGTIYEGFFRGGKKNGKGKLTFPNGDIYNGNWVNGERHGHGEYNWKSGAKYEGEYTNNQRNGNGIFTFADGKVYNGQWRDGLRTGRGKLMWENGDTYEGDFFKSHRTGKGMFKR